MASASTLEVDTTGVAHEWASMRRLAGIALVLALGGCGARDCVLDIAHRDCPETQALATTFPQDDANCRSYGLAPDTRAYAKCREDKSHVHRLTKDESDYGFLRNPILPSLH